jgi:hypothetical protein
VARGLCWGGAGAGEVEIYGIKRGEARPGEEHDSFIAGPSSERANDGALAGLG